MRYIHKKLIQKKWRVIHPISLSSILLKSLERLLDVYVSSIFTPQNFCRHNTLTKKVGRYFPAFTIPHLRFLGDGMQTFQYAFYTCKKTFGNRGGLKPNIVHCMYSEVIRPILTYGAVIWWRVIETKSHTFMLKKFQRLCCLLITDVIKSTLQGSLNIILHIPLIPIICLKLLGELRHDFMYMIPT